MPRSLSLDTLTHACACATKMQYLHTKLYFSENSGKFIYLGSSVSSTENDINTQLAKAYVVWKSDLSYQIKPYFFQAAFVSILLYGCTIWTLTEHIEKKPDSNCTRLLRVILNKSWKYHLTEQQLYCFQPPISKTIRIRRTRHAEHY